MNQARIIVDEETKKAITQIARLNKVSKGSVVRAAVKVLIETKRVKLVGGTL